VQKPLRYAMSFYGVIDLLALLPTFLVALAPEFAYLIDVRILRLLRVFRIFKLSRYSVEYRALVSAVAASRRKITVFVGFVMLVVLVMGTLMYVVEGPEHGFTSIPVAVYWAISTMATVGFGDLVPKTDLGRTIASVMMLIGWGVLAVPTGIVTAEMARRGPEEGPVPVAPRGVFSLAVPETATPRKRLTPAARRRALAQHRRSPR
jgi:voltage-gated potassium channel